MLEFKDLFRLDDGFTSLPGWDIFAGPVFAQDNAIGLAAGGDQVIALTATELDSLEHMARCQFRLTQGSDDVRVGLLVRAERLLNVSPPMIHRTYLITITGAGVIRIFRITTGDPTPAPFATATVSLDLTIAHTLIVKVRDSQSSQKAGNIAQTELLVYLDDEVSPVLTTFDQRVARPEGLFVGIDITDTDHTQAAFIGEFYTHVLRSAIIRNPSPIPILKNFGDLQRELGFRTDRAGNSQFDQEARAAFLNYAMNEIYLEEGFWKWAERRLCFATAKGVREYELPAYVSIPGGLTDRSNGRMLTKGTWKDMRRINPDDAVGTSTPLGYGITGTGDFGGPVVFIQPVPDGQYTLEMPFYAKPVPMIDDTDIPMIPPEYLEVLLYGALKRTAQYSDNSTLWQTASADWQRMMAKMKRANHRDPDMNLHLRTNRHLSRISASGTAAFRRRVISPFF